MVIFQHRKSFGYLEVNLSFQWMDIPNHISRQNFTLQVRCQELKSIPEKEASSISMDTIQCEKIEYTVEKNEAKKHW